MFMSFVLHRKTFDWFKYASVLLITVGVSAFMLLHSQRHVKSTSSDGGSIDSSLLGLALLLVNLLLDGATNSTQDQIFRAWRVTGGQMMVWMNACSTALMVVFMSVVQPFLVSSGSGALTALGFGVSMTPTLAASELVQGVAFLRAYPQALFDVLLFGVVGSVGQIFIFHTLERWVVTYRGLLSYHVHSIMHMILLTLHQIRLDPLGHDQRYAENVQHAAQRRLVRPCPLARPMGQCRHRFRWYRSRGAHGTTFQVDGERTR